LPTPLSHSDPSSPDVSVGSASGAPVDSDTLRELLKEQDVKKQRLARKAELARMSRKRKKMRLTDLEEEVERLKDELERATKRFKSSEEKLIDAQQQVAAANAVAAARPVVTSESQSTCAALDEQSKQLHQAIRHVLMHQASQRSGMNSRSDADVKMQQASSSMLPALVADLIGVMKKKSALIGSQVGQVKDQMELPLALRFLEWAMNQTDRFFADPSGLWSSLCHREIGLTPEQLERMMNLRQEMQTQRSSSADVQMAYNQFQSCLQAHLDQGESNLGRVLDILSPEQLAKFFAWVDQYGPICVKINL